MQDKAWRTGPAKVSTKAPVPVRFGPWARFGLDRTRGDHGRWFACGGGAGCRIGRAEVTAGADGVRGGKGREDRGWWG